MATQDKNPEEPSLVTEKRPVLRTIHSPDKPWMRTDDGILTIIVFFLTIANGQADCEVFTFDIS